MSVVSINSGRHRERVLERRNRLVEENLDLVHQVASSILRNLPPCFEYDDLVSAGTLGLLHAATHYRPAAHGETPFLAYARPRVRGAILDSVRRGKWRDAVADGLEDVPERSVVVNIEEGIDGRRRQSRLTAAVADLDERHAAVIDWHYREELGLRAVGEKLGVGKSRASQLHMEAVRELRAALV